ncbi:hypothetical protein Halar_1851 [halophilic archaeon DL31]|jgi:hypothetical protein|nr:hypothetical protein Halar_1851 [halophilic archaeon DL31]
METTASDRPRRSGRQLPFVVDPHWKRLDPYVQKLLR